MTKNKIYGYIRVSSTDQNEERQLVAKADWRRRPFTAGCGSTGWQTCRGNNGNYRKVYFLVLTLIVITVA